MGLEKKTAVRELNKHVATIHCSNTLSLLQRKISNALLYHAYKELLLKEEHEISIKQLCNLISYQGHNHAVIKDALKGLLSTIIEWNVVNDTVGREDWSASSILASVSLRGPLCLYAYSPRMKELLHSPSMFGKINLFIQSRFKSNYGLALYENCIRYRGLPSTKWFELDLFRKIMGVPEDVYTVFRDFKRRVLDKSVEEVNTYSDLIVEPEVLREGRNVVKVRFLLKERAKKTRLGVSDEKNIAIDDREENLKSDLIAQLGLSMEQVLQVFSEYTVDYIAEKMMIVLTSHNYQQGKVLNLAAYFISALKNNYQSIKTSQQLITEKQQDQNKNNQKFKQQKEAYAVYREKKIDDIFNTLSIEQQQKFLQQFQQHFYEPIQTVLRVQRKKYTLSTVLDSPQIKGLFRQFALQELPDMQRELLSFEEFSSTQDRV